MLVLTKKEREKLWKIFDKSTVCNWEKGRRIPTMETAKVIAKTIKRPLNHLAYRITYIRTP